MLSVARVITRFDDRLMAGSSPSVVLARPSKRPKAANLLRISCGLALLAALYHWRFIDVAALQALLAHPVVLVRALAGALANLPLEAGRWHMLLRAQGLALPFTRTTRVFAMSLFFANFLPGAAGGDLIRGAYLYKAAQGRRTPALLSIALDRLLGFAAFVLLGLVAVAVRPAALHGVLGWSILALSLALVGALVALFLLAPRAGRYARHMQPWLAGIVTDLALALRLYARDRRCLGLAFLLSLSIAALAAVPVALIAATLPQGGLSILDYAIAALYALIANSLPVTPGGVGLGEAAFASACLLLAAPGPHAAYGTAFLAFRCVFVISTSPALLASLLDAGTAGRTKTRQRNGP